MEPVDCVLERFEQISAVPRGVKQEAGIRAWLREWAEKQGLESRVDRVGNLVIVVPASPGYEDKPTLILQGHMDMIWQKTADSDHDFTRDSIRVLREGDWLKADRTTLGADNGIAIALMMALAEDKQLAHPRLEFLLTVEEELGVTGALGIDPAILSGRTLINLDSEEDGVFTIGSAGGQNVYMVLPVVWEPAPRRVKFMQLKVHGLQGGHSGGDINKQRANANKLMGRALAKLLEGMPIQIAALQGGTVRNAIPRESEARLAISPEDVEDGQKRVVEFQAAVQAEYARTEPGLAITLQETTPGSHVVSREDTARMIRLLLALPNGVAEMSTEIEGFVETSNNVGIMELSYEGFLVASSQRSAVASRLEEIVSRVEAIGKLAGAGPQRRTATPPWRPERSSPLLKKCIEVYRDCFGEEPGVEATHGGLECAILSARCGGLECISLGPTILNAHSPDEMLSVPSVERIWKLLAALLKAF
jgi:dipeptidase D